MPTFSPQVRNVALVVAATMFMQILDGVIIVTALPQMARDFGVPTLDMSIGVTAYMLASAVLIPTAAWAADRFGARRIYVVAIAIFCVASLACGLANSLPLFVAARILQGSAGALLFPVGRILVLRTARKSEIVQAIGLTVWPALFAPVLGPALGGFLTTYVSWHWNFWINLPLGVIGIALVLAFVPSDKEYREAPFDWPGFLLSGTCLAALLYGFDGLAQGTVATPIGLALAGSGIVLGLASIWWLRRADRPLLDLSTFRYRTFAASELKFGTIIRLTINTPPFLLPLMFQVGFGLDPLQSGSLVLVYFLGNLVMKAVTTPLLRRFGFRNILVWNGVLAGLSMFACGFFSPDFAYPAMLAILFAAGLTRSMQFTALATLSFAEVSDAQRGSASTLSAMSQQISSVFGIASAAALLALSLLARGGPTLALDDFRHALFVVGCVCMVTSLLMLSLAHDAGAEVSGHRRRAAA